MVSNTTAKPNFSSILKNDLPASIVVFLVALPLCLGIALASGAPLFSGIIAGIIGGIVVGFVSGSHIGVSGPAAGLAVIVLSAIQELGAFEVFLLAVVIVDGDNHEGPHYIRNPFSTEPDFGVASINYDLSDLLSKAVSPELTL